MCHRKVVDETSMRLSHIGRLTPKVEEILARLGTQPRKVIPRFKRWIVGKTSPSALSKSHPRNVNPPPCDSHGIPLASDDLSTTRCYEKVERKCSVLFDTCLQTMTMLFNVTVSRRDR